MRLTVFPTATHPSPIRGIFYCSPRAGAVDRSARCFSRRGEMEPDGLLRLQQDMRIQQPDFHVMADLESWLNDDGMFAATAGGPGCSSFALRDVLPLPDEATACEALSQQRY